MLAETLGHCFKQMMGPHRKEGKMLNCQLLIHHKNIILMVKRCQLQSNGACSLPGREGLKDKSTEGVTGFKYVGL